MRGIREREGKAFPQSALAWAESILNIIPSHSNSSFQHTNAPFTSVPSTSRPNRLHSHYCLRKLLSWPFITLPAT